MQKGLLVVAFVAAIGIGAVLLKNMMPADAVTPQNQVAGVQTENQSQVQPQTLEVEGGQFYYKPNEIRVKKGAMVKINFTNVEGFNDFVIDELNVRTSQIGAGKSEMVEFVADREGQYEFYCSVGKHREMGMKGTLIVE